MCGYFFIRFIGFMFAGKTLLIFFFQNDFKENDDIILNYFINIIQNWLNVIPTRQTTYV